MHSVLMQNVYQYTPILVGRLMLLGQGEAIAHTMIHTEYQSEAVLAKVMKCLIFVSLYINNETAAHEIYNLEIIFARWKITGMQIIKYPYTISDVSYTKSETFDEMLKEKFSFLIFLHTNIL
jgi:hypothetical protein